MVLGTIDLEEEATSLDEVTVVAELTTIQQKIDRNIFNADENGLFHFEGQNVAKDFVDFIDAKRNRTTINLDYVNPISETVKLEAGAQVPLFDSEIDVLCLYFI